jgi:hypothetical protein
MKKLITLAMVGLGLVGAGCFTNYNQIQDLNGTDVRYSTEEHYKSNALPTVKGLNGISINSSEQIENLNGTSVKPYSNQIEGLNGVSIE